MKWRCKSEVVVALQTPKHVFAASVTVRAECLAIVSNANQVSTNQPQTLMPVQLEAIALLVGIGLAQAQPPLVTARRAFWVNTKQQNQTTQRCVQSERGAMLGLTGRVQPKVSKVLAQHVLEDSIQVKPILWLAQLARFRHVM